MAVASTMLALGTPAPSFQLKDTEDRLVCLDDFTTAAALVVVFLCNHCPYVQHIADRLAELSAEYIDRDVAIVGINSNDPDRYPEDAPSSMSEEKRRRGYPFPYLFDETQEVSKAYRAACTPDLYVFDSEARLVYRGQFDGSRPGNDVPVTGYDLCAALDSVLTGMPAPEDQIPSIGCGIKWRPDNEPDYASR